MLSMYVMYACVPEETSLNLYAPIDGGLKLSFVDQHWCHGRITGNKN